MTTTEGSIYDVLKLHLEVQLDIRKILFFQLTNKQRKEMIDAEKRKKKKDER